MNIREWQKLAKKHLLPHFPDLTLSGRWLFHAPIGWQLRCFGFEPSEFHKLQFSVYASVSPLYVPQELDGTFSEFIGWMARKKRGEIWWDLGQDSAETIFADIQQRIQQDVIPYQQQRSTVEAMTKIRQHQMIQLSDDHYVFQAMICAGILLDDARVVEREWQRFSAYHSKYAAPNSPKRDTEMYQVTERIYRQFQADPTAARCEIARWRQERAAELNLSTFLADEPDDLRCATRPHFKLV